MAAETIKEFLVSVGFDVDEESLRLYASKAANFAKGIGAAFAAAAGSFALVSTAVKQTVNRFDELGVRANRIGIAADELERLSYIANQSASSSEALQSSLERFSMKLGEVSSGLGQGGTKRVFESLGISLSDSQGVAKSATDVLSELGNKITDLDRTQQLNILSKLGLDSSLLGMLTTDVGRIGQEFDDLYQRGNFSMSKLSDTSNQFNDALSRMRYTFDIFKWSLVDSIIEPLVDSANTITKTFRDMVSGLTKALRPLFKTLGNIISGLLKVMRRFMQGIQWAVGGVYSAFSWLFNEMPFWAKAVIGLTLAVKALFMLFAASPIGFVTALVVAIGALIDDFLVWKKGGQSLIDWAAWEPAITAATDAIKNIIEFLRNLTSSVFALIGAFVKLFSGDFDGFFGDMRVAVDSVVQSFERLFGAASKIKDFLGGAIGGAASWAKTALNKAGIHALDSYLPAGQTAILSSGNTQQAGNHNVKVTNNITVQASANPEATGAAVAKAEQQAYKDAVRNGRAVVR